MRKCIIGQQLGSQSTRIMWRDLSETDLIRGSFSYFCACVQNTATLRLRPCKSFKSTCGGERQNVNEAACSFKTLYYHYQCVSYKDWGSWRVKAFLFNLWRAESNHVNFPTFTTCSRQATKNLSLNVFHMAFNSVSMTCNISLMTCIAYASAGSNSNIFFTM